MRILQVVSYLPPNHLAGVEIYTERLIQSLRATHDMGVFYAETVPGAREHELRIGEREGVPAFEVIHDRNFLSFEESYTSPALRETSRRVLDAFRPDLVHVQHLMNHSLSLLEELRVRGIPCIMTVHDHWLECAAGGNRFHREWGACDELDARRCGHCMAHMSGPALRARALLARRWPAVLGSSPGQNGEVGPAAPPDKMRTLPLRLLRLGSRLARLPTGVMAGRIERRWQATRAAGGGLDLLLAPSHFMEGELLRFGIARDKVRYCEHGFPRANEGRRRSLPDAARHFVFV